MTNTGTPAPTPAPAATPSATPAAGAGAPTGAPTGTTGTTTGTPPGRPWWHWVMGCLTALCLGLLVVVIFLAGLALGSERNEAAAQTTVQRLQAQAEAEAKQTTPQQAVPTPTQWSAFQPSPPQPQAQAAPTPTQWSAARAQKPVTEHTLVPGESWNVPGSGWACSGDIEVDSTRLYDDDASTGLVVQFHKPATVHAPWGAHCATVDGGTKAEQLKKEGCIGGCSSVELKTWQ